MPFFDHDRQGADRAASVCTWWVRNEVQRGIFLQAGHFLRRQILHKQWQFVVCSPRDIECGGFDSSATNQNQ